MNTIEYELETLELLADRLEEHLLEITNNNENHDSRVDELLNYFATIDESIYEARMISSSFN